MSRKRLIYLGCVLLVVVMAATAIVTYFITKAAGRTGEIYLAGDEYEKLMQYFELEDIAGQIEASYYKDIDEDLTYGAMYGMVEALNDGYSRFYKEEDFRYFDAKSEGSYIGQGMMLKAHPSGYMEVSRVFADTPAYDANIQVGDLILSIDGRNTKEIDVDNAVSRLRGLEGTTLHLVVRSREGAELNISMPRKSPTVQVVFSDMLKEDIGYIEIMEFSGTCVSDFEKALDTVTKEGAKKLVIDLRQAPGGYISQGTELADHLLNKGVICTVNGRKEGDKNTIKADAREMISSDVPIVLLVDEETAGAAEIFALALQENGRAQVVGQKTKGKGVALSFIGISGTGDGLKLVTAEYTSPSGAYIDGYGVTPDMQVVKDDALREEDRTAENDVWLVEALALLDPSNQQT